MIAHVPAPTVPVRDQIAEAWRWWSALLIPLSCAVVSAATVTLAEAAGRLAIFVYVGFLLACLAVVSLALIGGPRP